MVLKLPLFEIHVTNNNFQMCIPNPKPFFFPVPMRAPPLTATALRPHRRSSAPRATGELQQLLRGPSTPPMALSAHLPPSRPTPFSAAALNPHRADTTPLPARLPMRPPWLPTLHRRASARGYPTPARGPVVPHPRGGSWAALRPSPACSRHADALPAGRPVRHRPPTFGRRKNQ
jgi:hypothetical protein